MAYDRKCKYRKSCGYDFCMGEGMCPEFAKGKPIEEGKYETVYNIGAIRRINR